MNKVQEEVKSEWKFVDFDILKTVKISTNDLRIFRAKDKKKIYISLGPKDSDKVISIQWSSDKEVLYGSTPMEAFQEGTEKVTVMKI
jgi:ABC-type uncharacterized transport system auxiliary subunit